MSLYAAYALNEGSGSTILDYSGHGRNLTVAGSNSWITGKYYPNAFQAGATSSDGAQWDAGSAQAALSGDVTVMLWYQHTTTADTGSHAGGFYSASGTARLAVWSYRSLSGVLASPLGTIRDSAGTIIPYGVTGTHTDTSWHHAAFVYHSSGLIEEYLDGSLIKSSSPTANPIGTTVRFIGVGGVLSGAIAQAATQDMRVFDAALTAADISIYMNTPVVNQVVMPPAMQAARILLRRRTQPQLPAPPAAGTAQGTAAIAGQGTVTATATATAPATAAGQGAVTTASATQAAAAPAGQGQVADASAAQAGGTITGAGLVGAPASQVQAPAAVAGQGSVSSASAIQAPATAAGQGQVATAAAQQAPATAAGQGAVTTATAVAAGATAAGQGQVAASTAPAGTGTATGAGQMSATAAQQAPAILAGQGTVTTAVSVLVTAVIAGAGQVTAASSLTAAGQATAAGQGSVTAAGQAQTPVQLGYAAAGLAETATVTGGDPGTMPAGSVAAGTWP